MKAKRMKWLTIAAAAVAMQIAVGYAFAGALGDAGVAPASARATRPTQGPLVRKIGNLYPVQGVFVSACTESAGDCSSSKRYSSWTDLPGAVSLQFTVPAGITSALVFARFSAQTACLGGFGVCEVRLRVTHGGTTTTLSPVPNSGSLIFDSGANKGNDQLESHGVEQAELFLDAAAPGDYLVKAQVRTSPFSGSTTTPFFDIRSWTLTTETAFY